MWHLFNSQQWKNQWNHDPDKSECLNLTCLFKCEELTPLYSQCLHLNGFSPVWILKCFFKSLELLKARVHTLQAYGFSPVWVLKWTFRLICWLKVLWQMEHSNGFSPVCTSTCRCRSHDCGNIFPQKEHGCQSWEDNFLMASKEAAEQLSLDNKTASVLLLEIVPKG